MGDLEDNEIKLVLDRATEADPDKGWVPAYHFSICDKQGMVMGRCVLRVGDNNNTYYGGHIGYEIDEEHRGHHYAVNASLLLLSLAKKHGMKRVYVTCNPDNIPSRKTCERIGGELLEITKLPADNNMRIEKGETEKCVYQVDLMTS